MKLLKKTSLDQCQQCCLSNFQPLRIRRRGALIPFGNLVSVDRIDSNEGLGTKIWNATLGNPRVQGGLMLVGGIGEMIAGGVLWAVTKIAGATLVGHGADMAAIGLKQLWSGQSTQTFTSQGLSTGLQNVGVPPYYAGMVGGLTEIGVAVMPVAIVAKVGTAGKVVVKVLHSVSGNTARSAFGGIPYSPQKLPQLTNYLERRGIQVMKTW